MLIGKLRRRQAVRYAVVNALVMERRLQQMEQRFEYDISRRILPKMRELDAERHNHHGEKRGMMVPE